jgi:ABC-type branched-subunit amino acid transport system ATPase component
VIEGRGLTVDFGGLRALDAVGFAAGPGEVLGIIGPNGAGKTTLFNVITGLVRPSAGWLSLEGRPLLGVPRHQVARLGVARTFQTPAMFWGLTVRQSLMVALRPRVEGSLLASALGLNGSEAALRLEAERLLSGTPLEAVAELPSEALSFGQERLLEVLRALASRPKVLLLDEPLSGLNPGEIRQVLDLLARVRDAGTAVLWIEHDLGHLLAVADRVMVLDRGRVIAVGLPDEVRRDPAVVEAYIGEDAW